jgi:hypothetical protein
MEAEDLLDKFAQDEGFGNWDTVVLNCHHSVIRSVAIAAVNEALRQPPLSGCNADSDKLVECSNCGDKVEMISSGEFCPHCFC